VRKKNDAEPMTKIPSRRYGLGPLRGVLGGAPGGGGFGLVDILAVYV
jgi:hypothetical protein